MSGGGDAPEAADTVGAAKETGEQARRLNEAQTYANRPNQNNAWGSTSWENTPTWDATTGQYINDWTQNETLNPLLQQQVDSNMRIDAGRAGMAEGAMARAYEDFQNPMDFDQYGDSIKFDPSQYGEASTYADDGWRQTAEDNAYSKATSRLDPQYQQREEQMMSKLRSQGLGAGDVAYDKAVDNFNRDRGDSYEQARLGSTSEGRTEGRFGMDVVDQSNTIRNNEMDLGYQNNELQNSLRSQDIEEGMAERNFNLTEAEMLRQGTGVAGGPPTSGGQTETIANKYVGGGTA